MATSRRSWRRSSEIYISGPTGKLASQATSPEFSFSPRLRRCVVVVTYPVPSTVKCRLHMRRGWLRESLDSRRWLKHTFKDGIRGYLGGNSSIQGKKVKEGKEGKEV